MDILELLGESKPEKKGTSLEDSLYSFLAVQKLRGIKEITLRNYESNILLLIKAFQELGIQTDRVREIDKEAARKFVEWSMDRYSISSINFFIRTAHVLWSELLRNGEVKLNIWQRMKIKEPAIERYTPSHETVKKGLITLASRGSGFRELRDTLIYMLLSNGGMRVRELSLIQVSNINMEKGTILLVETKNGKSRLIGISQKVQAVLRAYLKIREASHNYLLINSRNHKPLGVRNIQKLISDLGEEIGAEKLTAHSLRRYRTTSLLESGVNPVSVAKMLGHSNIQLLYIYHNLEDVTLYSEIGE